MTHRKNLKTQIKNFLLTMRFGGKEQHAMAKMVHDFFYIKTTMYMPIYSDVKPIDLFNWNSIPQLRTYKDLILTFKKFNNYVYF